MTELKRRAAEVLFWGLLSSGEIERLIQATLTEPLTPKLIVDRLGFRNWQDWLDSICKPVSLRTPTSCSKSLWVVGEHPVGIRFSVRHIHALAEKEPQSTERTIETPVLRAFFFFRR